jgi:hypothetical protein
MSNPLQVICSWKTSGWAYWRAVSNKFSIQMISCSTTLATELTPFVNAKVTSVSETYVTPGTATKTVNSAIQPKYTDTCTNPVTCKVHNHNPGNCLSEAEYPHASCVVTSTSTLATQITFDGTMDHLNVNLMLSFSFTNVPQICDSTVFNLDYVQVCTSLTTELISPHATKVSSVSETYVTPGAPTITVDSAI